MLHAEICNLGLKWAVSCFRRASRGKEESCRSKAIGVFLVKLLWLLVLCVVSKFSVPFFNAAILRTNLQTVTFLGFLWVVFFFFVFDFGFFFVRLNNIKSFSAFNSCYLYFHLL